MPDIASMVDTTPYTTPSYGPPAEWAKRAVAYLIDLAPVVVLYIAGFIVAAIFGAIADALGLLVLLAVYAAVLAYGVYNLIIAQGRSGQSFGKKQQGLRLVSQATNLPLGPGMVLVRYLVAGALSGVTCGIYGILDLLWPLWDADKARLTDKILKNKVVVA
jgi:uncharacterized RDD family membrane protein YckC